MRKIIADMHMHTLASGHAYGTIREMAQAAREAGLHLIGITEHAPGIPGTVNPFYYLNLKAVPREISGVKIMHGCEINVLNDGTLSLEQKYIDCLDYAVIGIHVQCYENQGKARNTENIVSCMMNPKVAFVSHPDDGNTPLDYELLVAAAKKNRVALEVNNSSLLKPEVRINCFGNYRKMLSLCMEHRVSVVVSSDAHDPGAVGGFDSAVKLLESVGFDEELILNNDMDRMAAFFRRNGG